MSENLKTTLFIVLSVYAVMGVGAFCGKIGWLNTRTRKDLLAIVINVLCPCLIIKNVLANPVFNDPRNLYGPPLIGFGIILVSVIFGWILAKALPTSLTTLDTTKKIGTFAACLGMLNYGYVPIPLIENSIRPTRGYWVSSLYRMSEPNSRSGPSVFHSSADSTCQTVKNLLNVPVLVMSGVC